MINKYKIGIDEAGRGPLAGPIVAAAIFSAGSKKEQAILSQVDDSKKLSAEKREGLYNVLINNFVYSVQVLDNNFIDRYGIQNANVFIVYDVYESLLKKIKHKEIVVLADYVGGHGGYFSKLPINFYKQGESKYKEIAAASIIAKVYRDRLMQKIHFVYPEYNLSKHKGYGTKEHVKNIFEYGPSEFHRKSFIKRLV